MKFINNIKMKIKNFNLKKFIKNLRKTSHAYLQTNILFTSFVIVNLINGCLLRFFTVQNYLTLKPILADLAVILIVGSFGYFVKPKHQFKYFFSWAIVFTIICVVHSIYYNNYVSFASLSLLGTTTQLEGMGEAVVKNVMEFKDFSYLWSILAMMFINASLKKRHYYEIAGKKERGKVRAVNTLITGFIVLVVFALTLTTVDLGRFAKQWNREYIVMKFGIYTYQINDIVSSIKPQISPLFGYDKAAKEFREFYDEKDKEVKKTNEYTNIFKDKNVIVIHAESIQNYTLDTSFNGIDLAPNLKKLSKEGLYFSNFYAQESVGTSSDTEFTFATSLLPASSGTVFVSYWNREYISIQKLLNEQGYYTFSMHGNNCDFWNRKTMHKQLGYDKFYCYTDDFNIDEKIGLGLSDKSFFKQSIEKIKKIKNEHDKFYGTMIMLTNHTPFTDIENYSDYEVDYKYEKINEKGEKEIVSAPFMEGTTLGSYFKSVHYADEALGEFIDNLDKEGLLEDTVIVIYGDHDSKIKKKEYTRYYNYDYETDSVRDQDDPDYVDVDYYKYELNRKVPLIIWTKDHEYQKEITEVMGMYDVLPTLGNMLGVASPYQLGTDIFSTNNNIVVFPDGNWLTNSMYYNSQKEESFALNNNAVNVDEIANNSVYASKLIDISNNIIVYDMIAKTKETQKLIDKYDK